MKQIKSPPCRSPNLFCFLLVLFQVAFLSTLAVYTGQFPFGGNSNRYSTKIHGANIAMTGSPNKTPEAPQANRNVGKMALLNETKTAVTTSVRLKAAATKINVLSNTPTPTQPVRNESLVEADLHNETKTTKIATIIITKTATTKLQTLKEHGSVENRRGLAKIVLLNGTKTTVIVTPGIGSMKPVRSMSFLDTTPTRKHFVGNVGLATTALFKETKTAAPYAYSTTSTIKNLSITVPIRNATSKGEKEKTRHVHGTLCCKRKMPTSIHLAKTPTSIHLSIRKTNNVAKVSAKNSLRSQVNSTINVPPTNAPAKKYKIKTLNTTNDQTTPRGKPFQHIAGKNGGKTKSTASSSTTNKSKVRSSNKTEHTTDVQNLSSRPNLIRRKINSHRNVHPCNTIHTSAMSFTVNSIKCRRWAKQELQHQMNCLGTFNHQFLAASIQDAMHFKDLETGKSVNFSRSFVMRPVDGHRLKRSLNINPGETLVAQCHARKTITESGTLRICPVCTAITRQPLEPRRFPEYMNELLCDPQMQTTYLPGIDGFCVQKTFTLELLQFNGEWELNNELTLQAGYSVYTEKWQSYTQTIRRHCACELLPTSPMAIYL